MPPGWTVLVAQRSEPLVKPGVWGHKFTVGILLHYQPNPQKTFIESPRLRWFEKIWYRDHVKRTAWTFEGDMYVRKPGSAQFQPWTGRYFHAWNTANGIPSALQYGNKVELQDMRGNLVRFVPAPGTRAPETNAEKADLVRRSIARMECQLYVELIDIPLLGIKHPRDLPKPGPMTRRIVGGTGPEDPERYVHEPKSREQINEEFNTLNKRRERLLLFDCGIEGDKTVRASQYLLVDEYQRANWKREFHPYWDLRESQRIAARMEDGALRGFAPDMRGFAPDMYELDHLVGAEQHGHSLNTFQDNGEYL
jgi:hypothetical protein